MCAHVNIFNDIIPPSLPSSLLPPSHPLPPSLPPFSDEEDIQHIDIQRDSSGFGFSIRGGAEYNAPLCVLRMAPGGAAEKDGRLRVSHTYLPELWRREGRTGKEGEEDWGGGKGGLGREGLPVNYNWLVPYHRWGTNCWR